MTLPLAFSLFILSLHFPTLITSLNISHLIHYSIPQQPPHPHPYPFVKDVLKMIEERKNWDLRTIRVSNLEKVRFGYSKSHAFYLKFGNKTDLVARFSEQVDSWIDSEIGDSFEELVRRVESEAVIRLFRVHGPFVLSVGGSGDDRLLLKLPMSSSFSQLKQIVVGEGITLEIKGAQEVSFSVSSCTGMLNGTSCVKNKERLNFWQMQQPFCPPLLPIRVVGSVYATAFIRNNSVSAIEKNLLAKDIVELRLLKCYPRYMYEKPTCPANLSSRVVALQHIFRSLLGDKINQQKNHSLSFQKAIMKASTFVRFQLELHRVLGTNDSQQDVLPEWRTKPTVERGWFDVVARVNFEKLKPVTVKQVRPFISRDSTSWSHRFSNISFTEFSNVFVPPHPLTLDVKW